MADEGLKKEEVGILSFDYLKQHVGQLLKQVSSEKDPASALAKLFDDQYREKLSSDNSSAFDDLIKGISVIDGDLIIEATKLLQRYLKLNFTEEELLRLEANRGDRFRAKEEDSILNDVFHYLDHGKSISIHTLAISKDDYAKFVPAFTDAMRKLADKLQNDEDLQSVETIFMMNSWLVEKYSSVIEARTGFKINPDKPGEANINRNDFIAKYGNK